jgi:hypothetical protein
MGLNLPGSRSPVFFICVLLTGSFHTSCADLG